MSLSNQLVPSAFTANAFEEFANSPLRNAREQEKAFLIEFEKTISKFDKEVNRLFLKAQLPLFKKAPLLIDAAINAGPHEGLTPLLIAANWHLWESVEEMLRCHPNANVDATPSGAAKGKTPLWYAAEAKRWDLVLRMLEHNPQANIEACADNDKGRTVLWLAANWNQWPLIHTWLKSHPNANVNALPLKEFRGDTPVWRAANWREWTLFSKMLKGHPKTNLDHESDRMKGWTCLTMAANDKRWDIVEEILQAQPKAIQSAGPRLLERAFQCGHMSKAISKIAHGCILLGFPTPLGFEKEYMAIHTKLADSLQNIYPLCHPQFALNPFTQFLNADLCRVLFAKALHVKCTELPFLPDDFLIEKISIFMHAQKN